MGVIGVALATFIARTVSMTCVLILLTRKNQPITWEWKQKYRPNRELIGKILYIGLPSSLENSMFQLGKLVIMSIVAVFGTAHITANAVANNLSSLGYIPGSAIGLALLTVVGQCVGARDEVQIRYYTKKLMKVAYLVGGIVNALTLVVLPWILQLYSISEETARLTTILVWINDGSAIFFWQIAFTLANALRAANDVRYTMTVSIFSMIAFRVLCSYILGLWLGMGVVGVWIAMIIDWLFRGAMFVTRVCGKKWIRKAIPEEKEAKPQMA
jgi:Na+-driven multidrug efflux pump